MLLGGDVVAKKPTDDAPQVEKDVFNEQIQRLMALKPVLEGTSFVVAYRFANEYMLYASALNEMYKVIEASGGNTELFATGAEGIAKATAPTTKAPEPFDDMILMKVLPRISGDTEMVLRIFTGELRQNNDQNPLDNPQGGLAKLLGKESASVLKMKEIVKRGEASGTGTLTFWP